MLATSRVKRTRWPLAEMLIFSFTLAPLNSSVSLPEPPSTMSLPSPGFQMKVSSPLPSRAMSLPRPPVMMSLPAPPISDVVAVAAGDGVVAGAAVDGERDQAGEAIAGGEDVIAAVHVQHEILGRADVERERSGADAVEAHARAVCGDRERFGAVAAVDQRGVVAVAAFEQVGAAAGIPDHACRCRPRRTAGRCRCRRRGVVAVAAEQQVVAAFAVDGVVAGLSEQQVVARAAGELVVAVAAEQIDPGHRAVGFRRPRWCRCRPARTPGSRRCWRPSVDRPRWKPRRG